MSEELSEKPTPEPTKEPTKKSKKAKEAKPSLAVRLLKFVEQVMTDPLQTAGSFKNGIYKLIRIVYASVEKFMRDEGFLRGSSISYALVVSFIPTLVVLLLVGGKLIDREEYFSLAREFVKQNNVPLDLTPYFEIINELLNNAAAIGGIGLLVMLFSATSVLRNVEDALNNIWRVHHRRPIIQKISGFLMVLVLGPILLITGISIAQSLLNRFSSPDLKAIRMYENNVIVVGDKRVIIERGEQNNWRGIRFLSRVDYTAQKDPVVFNVKEKRVITGQEYADKYLQKAKRATKSELALAVFTDFHFSKNSRYMITKSGSMLTYNHLSQIWDVQKFHASDIKIDNIRLNKMLVVNDKEIYIAADDSLVLATRDGGDNWQVQKISEDNEDLNDLSLTPDGRILIVGKTFSAYVSNDRGGSWAPFHEMTRLKSKEKENLHSIYFNKDHGIVVGQFGTYLESFDSGKSWSRRQLGIRNHDFQKVTFIDDNTGVLIGDAGLIRLSRDKGRTWRQATLNAEVNLNDLVYDNVNQKLFLIGDKYNIITNRDATFERFSVIVTSPFWRKFITATGNFILPFAVIWILFFLVYKVMPYTTVTTKAAAVGAAVTSSLWVVFLLLFRFYLQSFTGGTLAIYGTLAAIPISLLLIYTSSLIMIFGAEVAYFIQYPNMIKLTAKGWKLEHEKRQIWYGMEILHEIYSNFENGSGPTKQSSLVKLCNNDQEECQYLLDKLLNEKVITKVEDNFYLPQIDADKVSIEKLVEVLDSSDYTVPTSKNSPFAKKVKKLFDSVSDSKSEKLQKITFKSIMDTSKE